MKPKTLEEYKAHLQNIGYIEVKIKDASEWYRHQVRREYEPVSYTHLTLPTKRIV